MPESVMERRRTPRMLLSREGKILDKNAISGMFTLPIGDYQYGERHHAADDTLRNCRADPRSATAMAGREPPTCTTAGWTVHNPLRGCQKSNI
jgi:hypothetical protein